MTMLKVKLLTSLKESSGSTLTSGSKVYPKGAVLNGTLDTLPKAVADAIKGKEWYVSVTEVQTDLLPEVDSHYGVTGTVVIDPSDIDESKAIITAIDAPEADVSSVDDLDAPEGESTSTEEKDTEDDPEDNLKEKIEKANRKLRPKE